MRHLTGYFFLIGLLVFLASCDPCRSTVCLNDGHCANGDCVCPEGFSGSDCSVQETPVRIRVHRIDVTRFPPTDDNGAGWDLTSGPDIYPDMLHEGVQFYKSETFHQNATSGNTYRFDFSPAVDLDNPRDEYTIRLYDFDDFDADDFMGGIFFTPYSDTNGFPEVFDLDAGGAVAFKVYVSYVW